MNRFPTGSLPCPKCGHIATLRAQFFIDRDTGGERMRGTCCKCGFWQMFYTRDHEGSSNA